MKTWLLILPIVFSLLASAPLAVQAGSVNVPTLSKDKKQAPQSIYYFNENWEAANKPVPQGFYRKLLGTTPEGWFLIQDFYQGSDIKQSSPIFLRDSADLKEGAPKSIEGLLVLWYENGNKDLEINYKGGKEQGLLQKWYESGQKQTERIYVDGKEDGLATLWDIQGEKILEINYKEGDFNGFLLMWKNGKKIAEEHYKQGEKEGLSLYWDDEGNKRIEKNYTANKLNGAYITFYINGNKQSEFEYTQDKLIITKLWYENGKQMAVIDKDPNTAFCQIWDDNGVSVYDGDNIERCILITRNILGDDNEEL